MRFLKPILTGLFAFSVLYAAAQHKPAPAKPAAVKFKPPKLFSSLGGYKDSSAISKTEAARIISLPLKITDAQNNVYTISSYNFVYKKIVPTEDDNMSKVSFTTSVKSSLFTATPLPLLWSQSASENLNPGEEYYFFQVIVKDSKGRVMLAPDLKFVIK